MWKHESKSEVLHGYEGQKGMADLCLESSIKQYYLLLIVCLYCIEKLQFSGCEIFYDGPSEEPAVWG